MRQQISSMMRRAITRMGRSVARSISPVVSPSEAESEESFSVVEEVSLGLLDSLPVSVDV